MILNGRLPEIEGLTCRYRRVIGAQKFRVAGHFALKLRIKFAHRMNKLENRNLINHAAAKVGSEISAKNRPRVSKARDLEG